MMGELAPHVLLLFGACSLTACRSSPPLACGTGVGPTKGGQGEIRGILAAGDAGGIAARAPPPAAPLASDEPQTLRPRGCKDLAVTSVIGSSVVTSSVEAPAASASACRINLPDRFVFGQGSDIISSDQLPFGEQVARILRDHREIECVQMTGSWSTREGRSLGLQRARAVLKLLVSRGVEPGRLMASVADAPGLVDGGAVVLSIRLWEGRRIESDAGAAP